MNINRSLCLVNALVSLCVFLFIFLGLATVEAYSYKTNKWLYVASMNTRRSSVGVGVVDGKTTLC